MNFYMDYRINGCIGAVVAVLFYKKKKKARTNIPYKILFSFLLADNILLLQIKLVILQKYRYYTYEKNHSDKSYFIHNIWERIF